MPQIYREEKTVRIGEVDAFGRWRPCHIFTFFQELGEAHLVELGYGRDELVRRGVVLVLARTLLTIYRYPTAKEKIIAQTWYAAPKKIVYPRYFLISDQNGKELGFASTLWMLVDTSRHELADPVEAGFIVPEPVQDITSPGPAPGRLSFSGEPSRTVFRTPTYSDTDVNMHMNNARYAEWICDLFPMDRHKSAIMKSLQINYISEAPPGEALRIEVFERGLSFMARGLREGAKGSVFEAAGQWAEV